MISDKDKLEALIGLAIEKGWKSHGGTITVHDQTYPKIFISIGLVTLALEEIIFDHGFAKSIWGEDEPTDYGTGAWQPWEYQLQQMVIEENPINYLYQAVFGEEK